MSHYRKQLSSRSDMMLFVLCLVSSLANVLYTSASNCTRGQHCSSCEDPAGQCASDCYIGFYGPRCNITCSTGCNDNSCITHKGGTEKCLTGCKTGFYGIRCSIPCSSKEECQKCPSECEDGFCQLESSCVSECEDSYYGTNCSDCGADCQECDRRTGKCLENRSNGDTEPPLLQGPYLYYLVGGAGGFVVIVIVLICVCCRRRLAQRQGSLDMSWWNIELSDVKPRYYLPQYSEVKKGERGVTVGGRTKRRESYTDVYDAVSI